MKSSAVIPGFIKGMLLSRHLPWTMDLEARKVLLSDDFLDFLKMEGLRKTRI